MLPSVLRICCLYDRDIHNVVIYVIIYCTIPGASTQGGNGARCTMAKIGGKVRHDNDAFARIYNNLLLHKYIYYFTPVHF